MGTPNELNVRFLGVPWIERNGVTLDVSRQKSVALLALLALAPGPEPREGLASMLWPALEPRRSLAALRSALWDLREATGTTVASESGRGLALPEGAVWVDVVEVARLRAAAGRLSSEAPAEAAAHHEGALGLDRGDFLEGFSLAGHLEFEAWRSAQVERLRDARYESLSELIDLCVRADQTERALGHASRLVALWPADSKAHLRLMRVLVARGDRAGALAHYARCVRELAAHQRMPDDALQALYESLRGGPERPGASPSRAAPRAAPPIPPTSLVGRESELAAVVERLADPTCRLLTLTGQGGVGKTRLLVEVGRALAAQQPDAVRFVPLGAVPSAAHLATAISAATDIPQGGAASDEVDLVEGLRGRTMVLLLDGFEHLLSGAPLLAEILARAPGVRILVTSRERLHLRAEWAISIDGLRYVADPGKPASRPPAAELFWSCASRADPSVVPSPEDERGVLEVCRLVGGTPLGIELAAACIRRYTPAEIAQKIEHDIDFLAAPRDAPASHRSLRATFRRSWDLLSEEERAALRRLSVLRDPFTEDAAAGVACADDAVLSALYEKYLTRRAGPGRIELHPLVCKYAGEELAISGEAEATRAAHARFFLGRCANLRPDSPGAEQASIVAELHAARADVLAAWTFAVGARDFEMLAPALYGFARAHAVHGRFREADAALAETTAVVRTALTEERRGRRDMRTLLGRLLCFRGRLGLELRPNEEVARMLAESLRLLRGTTATVDLCFALNAVGRLAYRAGEHDAARARFREALLLCKRAGDRRSVAIGYNNLSVVACAVGDYDRAERLLRKGIDAFRSLDDRASIAASLSSLGQLLTTRADLRGAEAALHEGLAIVRDAGGPDVRAMLLAYLGDVLLAGGSLEEAERRLGEAREIGQALGSDEILATVMLGLASVELRRGRFDHAERAAGDALDRWTRLRSRPGIADAERLLGTIAGNMGRAQDARARLLASLRTADAIHSVPLLLEALAAIGEQRAFGDAHARAAAGVVRAHPRASATVRARAERLLARLGGPAPGSSRSPADLGDLVRSLLEGA